MSRFITINEFSRIWERCSKFDFNLLTLRIGPFGVNDFFFHFWSLWWITIHDSRITIHEFSPTCLTSLQHCNIRVLNLPSQYNWIANLVPRVYDPVLPHCGGPKMDRFTAITDSRIFSEKPALSLFLVYPPLTLCQISKKSLERLLRKSVNQQTNRQTDRLTIPSLTSTDVENCSVERVHHLNVSGSGKSMQGRVPKYCEGFQSDQTLSLALCMYVFVEGSS